MATPYEIEHNIKNTDKKPSRRPDMSSFFSQLSQIESTNPRAQPTPVEVIGAERLLRDQFASLLTNIPELDTPEARLHVQTQTRALLIQLISDVEHDIESPPDEVRGVSQEYLDSLERVPKKQLKKTDTCPICGEKFLDDEYPLVVELPCHKTHRFDLECVGPWLRMKGTCPLDRKDFLKKKEVPEVKEVDEDRDNGVDRDLYG